MFSVFWMCHSLCTLAFLHPGSGVPLHEGILMLTFLSCFFLMLYRTVCEAGLIVGHGCLMVYQEVERFFLNFILIFFFFSFLNHLYCLSLKLLRALNIHSFDLWTGLINDWRMRIDECILL